MMQKILSFLFGLFFLGSAALAQAGTVQDPDTMVKDAVQDVLQVLRQEKADKKQIHDLVDKRVLPLFDFTLMTKRAVGRPWKTATDEQKKVLVDEFRTLLVRAFIGKAFNGNTKAEVKFKPSTFAAGDDQTTVRTVINTPETAPVEVDYDLSLTSEGWKVVDFAVAGPRLALDIYRNQFNDTMQQSGIDGLVKFLKAKNQAAENAVASAPKAGEK